MGCCWDDPWLTRVESREAHNNDYRINGPFNIFVMTACISLFNLNNSKIQTMNPDNQAPVSNNLAVAWCMLFL
jgi:hypothetical protein